MIENIGKSYMWISDEEMNMGQIFAVINTT